MTRGIVYVIWGNDPATHAMHQRSLASLAEHHPNIPVTIRILSDDATLLDKPCMFNSTEYDTTLYLDADTVVLGNLDFAFEKAEQFGLACCICECPQARRYAGLSHRGDMIEYNTGVIAFTKAAADVFAAWKRLATDIDSSLQFMQSDRSVATMPYNDQAGFAAAIDETGFNPFVLPLNWNFRPAWQKTAFGPIKIWHDYSDVPPWIHQWNKAHAEPDSVICCGRFE